MDGEHRVRVATVEEGRLASEVGYLLGALDRLGDYEQDRIDRLVTGRPLLDTLEVLAHDRYEALLKKTGVINEEFVDYRTRVVVRVDSDGAESVGLETSRAEVDVTDDTGASGAVVIEDQETRQHQAGEEMSRLAQQIAAREDLAPLRIPLLKMTKVELKFSLADITDLDPFEKLGRKLATDPDDDLRRIELGARIVTGKDGLRRTELVTTTGDRIVSAAAAIPRDEARAQLIDAVLGAEIVPPHQGEAKAAGRIVESFLRGLGDQAERVLSAFGDRAAARLVREVTSQHRHFVGKPQYENVVELQTFAPLRVARPVGSGDRTGAFSRSTGYEGWKRSMYPQVWFDSSTERQLALVLDDADEVAYWVRLHRGDLKILWQSDGREYNPDFVVVDEDGTHWLVEAKMNKEMESADVKGKETAAKRWANHVSNDSTVGTEWRYLLVSEDDIATAKGSWTAVKKLGTG